MRSSKPTPVFSKFFHNLGRLILLLTLLAISCSLPANTSGTPTQPLVSAIPESSADLTPEAQASPVPEKIVPSRSLTQIISARVTEGTLTEEESLLMGLRFLVGEISYEEAFGDTNAISTEGTGLIKEAQRYLKNGEDAQTRDEIQRYLTILMPSPEILEQFSRPVSQSSTSPHLASLEMAPRADEVVCQNLWQESFRTSIPITCLLRVERTVRGTNVRLYYPEYWGSDDPRLESVEAIMDAAEQSIALYNSFGPEPIYTVYMVLTDLPYFDTTEARFIPGVFAAADDFVSPSRCHVGIFPQSIDGSADVLEQTIAHELFHCYQFKNLRPQTFDVPNEINDWWNEGSAEFFGASVYPSNNAEFIYNGAFQFNSNWAILFDMSYENYLFFQYLAREGGLRLEGVIDLLRRMPTDGGFEEQQNALAAIDGMDEMFHAFARAYADHRLTDMSGATVNIEPIIEDVRSFGEGEHEELFDPASFFLGIYSVNFADQTKFENLIQEVGDPGQYAIRPLEFVGAWQPVPPVINTVCDPTQYILVVTSALPASGQSFQINLRSQGIHQESDICDECLKGTWELVNDSDFFYLGTLTDSLISQMPATQVDMRLSDVTGQLILNFGEHGQASGTHSDFTWLYMIDSPDGTYAMAGIFNGGGTAEYEIRELEDNERYIFFKNREFDLTYQLKAENVVIQTLPVRNSNGPFFLSESPAQYVCQENTLLYSTDPNIGTFRFIRVP